MRPIARDDVLVGRQDWSTRTVQSVLSAGIAIDNVTLPRHMHGEGSR